MGEISYATMKTSLAFENIHFIQLLASYKNNPTQFKAIIAKATDKELSSITEVILNFLNGNIKCNKDKIKRHKKFLRFVGDKLKPIKQRKKIILKRGHGVLTTLLSIAIPTLISMFSKK